jgi:hypothetical protein
LEGRPNKEVMTIISVISLLRWPVGDVEYIRRKQGASGGGGSQRKDGENRPSTECCLSLLLGVGMMAFGISKCMRCTSTQYAVCLWSRLNVNERRKRLVLAPIIFPNVCSM